MEIVSKAEFARRVGVSKPRISQLLAKGLPARADGRIDLAAGSAWISSHVDRSQASKRGGAGRTAGREAPAAPAPAPGPPASETAQPYQGGGHDAGNILLAAKAKRAIVDFRRAERLESLEAGLLAPVAELRMEFDGRVRSARGKLLGLGHRLAPRLAIETDAGRCKQIVDEAVTEAMADLAAEGGAE